MFSYGNALKGWGFVFGMPRAGLNSLPRPARSASNSEVRQGSCEWLCHSRDAGKRVRASSPAPKKYDHPLGGRIFLERRFCCAKSVACGRVIEREWGNPSKVPPSHSPFLAVGGSADNKTCGQSQKKRRPRASLFLEQGIRYRRVKKEGGRRASAPSEEKKQDPCGGDCSQPPR